MPLAAIGSRTYLKKLELEGTSSPALQKDIESLMLESAELRQRIETLETIATSSTALDDQTDAQNFERLEALASVSRR